MKKGFSPLEIPNAKKSSAKFLTGFTLIEVLLAIFILGLGIITSFNLFPLGLQSLSYANKLNEVYFLAEKKLEELKLQPNREFGQTSGTEKDLQWTIYTQPLKFPEGIEVTYVELDIELVFRGRRELQRFVTYLPG